jgi:hypothetical protein
MIIRTTHFPPTTTMPNTNTTTIAVTVLLTRDNGHDITTGALKRAALLEDIAGLDLEVDDIIVHDISVSTVTRVNDWHIAATYLLEVEVDADAEMDDPLIDVVDECLCFQPAEGWAFVHSTVLAR